jgi:hypothetical protein
MLKKEEKTSFLTKSAENPMIHQQSSNDIVATVEDIPAACEASDDQDTTVSPLEDNEVDENNEDKRDHTVRPTQKTTI